MSWKSSLKTSWKWKCLSAWGLDTVACATTYTQSLALDRMVTAPATRDRWLQTISSKHARITMTCEQGHGQQTLPCRQSSTAAQTISGKLLSSSKRLVWTSEWGERGRRRTVSSVSWIFLTFCIQFWYMYSGASSQAGVLCDNFRLLSSRWRSQWGFKSPGNICPNDIFWTA